MAAAWNGAWGDAWGEAWGSGVSPPVPTERVGGGGGGYGRWTPMFPDRRPEDEWRRRKEKAQALDEVIREAMQGKPAAKPDDEPEKVKVAVREATRIVEEARQDLPSAPTSDARPMLTAIERLEARLQAYEQRAREIAEDDEDILLLLG